MNLSDLKPRFVGPDGPTGATGPIGVTGPIGPTGAGGTQGFWGSFWSTQDQVALSANTQYAITLNNTDPTSFGVSVASNSRITFSSTGVYSITFSVQFRNTDTQEHDVDIWLKKNGNNISDTNSIWSVPSTHGGLDGHTIGTVNFVLSVAANDYIELFWKTDNTGVTLDYSAAATPSPGTPSVVVTATQVMYTQVGPTGATGAFVGNASTITTGTLGDARLSSNVTLGGNSFTGTGNIVRATSPTLQTPTFNGLKTAVRTISSSGAITATDVYILANAASGALVLTLPSASTVAGQIFKIKRIDASANALTVTDSTSTIDGQVSVSIPIQYTAITIASSGSSYYIL